MYRIVHFKRKPQQETVSSKTAKLIHDVRGVIGYTKVHLATFQNGTVGPASSPGLFFFPKRRQSSPSCSPKCMKTNTEKNFKEVTSVVCLRGGHTVTFSYPLMAKSEPPLCFISHSISHYLTGQYEKKPFTSSDALRYVQHWSNLA